MNKIQNLLTWCKLHTDGYSNVSVINFTFSWKSGLAFCALIHRFKPDLINFHELVPENVYYNNHLAFNVAEKHFGIPSLLDPKDMDSMECPERLSIITYVSQFYNCLKDMQPEGDPDINKFNDSIDNSYFDRFAPGRASVAQLNCLKCKLCHAKVYLLERYVADDQLYHRKCYRQHQLDHLEKQSDVIIEDYLNIYGNMKSNMNKNIFVHPLQGILSEENVLDDEADNLNEIETNEPVEMDDLSQSSGSSETLSSYHSSESLKMLESHEEIDLTRNKNETTPYMSHVICQENLVPNKSNSIKPVRKRLYIKRQDKELPYSTCFELSLNYQDATINSDIVINNPPEQHENVEKAVVKEDEENEPQKKLVHINFDEEYDSDESDLLNSNIDTMETVVKPELVRNSVWRTPIVCSSTSVRKHRSLSVSVESKFRDYYEFKERLKELNGRQSEVESKARKIQEALWEEDPESDDYEELLSKWLTLVEEKDKLFYEENALYTWIKDLKLNEMKTKLEAEIRLISVEKPTNELKTNEEELVNQLINVVNQRSQLVDEMHEENLRRLETSQLRHKAMEGRVRERRVDSEPIPTEAVQNVVSRNAQKPSKYKFWGRK